MPPLVFAFFCSAFQATYNATKTVALLMPILNALPERAKALNARFGVLPYINILNRLRANLL